jgi:hypothetical protein
MLCAIIAKIVGNIPYKNLLEKYWTKCELLYDIKCMKSQGEKMERRKMSKEMS